MINDTEDISSTAHDLRPLLRATEDPGAYGRVFWLAYLANGLVTVCNAMMFRYADFVQVLGGEERQLGLIVGCGMMGSILVRFAQGVGIDHYGAGRIWICSMVAYALGLVAHLGLTSAFSPSIFLARILMQSSVAGVFGASITFVSLRVPPQRMAEIVGTLGTSGFIGIMIGPAIGDWLCGSGSPERADLQRLFQTAAGIAVLATVATWFAVRGESRTVRRRQPRLSKLLRRYTPWMTALVAAAMGAGFAIPFTFLRPFAAELHIERIGTYFAVYAVSAFIARLSTRQLFERYGNRPLDHYRDGLAHGELRALSPGNEPVGVGPSGSGCRRGPCTPVSSRDGRGDVGISTTIPGSRHVLHAGHVRSGDLSRRSARGSFPA